jgi:cobalt-zinc-cadmium resistance protein CzcA
MRIVFVISLLFAVTVAAKGQGLTRDQAIDLALKNNLGIRTAGFEVEGQRQLKKSSFDLPKTEVTLMYGQYNSYAKNDNNITVSQSIPFSSFGSQGKLNKSLLASAELKKAYTENDLVFQVKDIYNRLAYTYSVHDLLLLQDSIFEGFYRAASLRYKAGESNLLEQTTADVQRNQAKIRMRENETELVSLRAQFQALLNTNSLPDIIDKKLSEAESQEILDSTLIASNPSLAFMRQQIDVSQKEKKVQFAKSAPDLLVGFFSQTLIGTVNPETATIAGNGERFTGFQVGVSLPLWFGPHQGRVRAAEYNMKAAQSNYESFRQNMNAQLEEAVQIYQTNKASLSYYQSSALPNADLILKQSQAAFKGGEIGYSEFLLGLRNAIDIQEMYLKTLRDYNQSIIKIEFLSGNK